MKKYLLFAAVAFVSQFAIAQNGRQESGFVTASEFHITRPLTEIFKENPVDEDAMTRVRNEESEDRENRKAARFKFGPQDGPQYGNDPKTIQDRMGDIPSEGPRANWLGQTASGFRPFDPSGAVGPNHYVQMINSTTFKVYDKASGSVLLTGTLGNLWSPATANAGDPIVMYDKTADRWFLAQFGTSTDKKIFIAVSTSNNPMGSYYTYTFVSPQFPDYLKFSVWGDGYYMTSNQSTQKVFCFERSAMLAGTPGARSVYVNYSPPKSGFFVPLPADAGDGTLPAAGVPCPIFSYEDNGWGTGFVDRVNIYQMAVNWSTTTPTGAITLAANVPTAAFDASYASNWNDVSQPGTTQKLDGIGGVCMYRAQFKQWSGYNTVVLNWAVKISTSQRSIKWVELRQNQTSGAWSLYQEGIYTPDASTRWLGSIAMDNNGSIGLSYIKSNSTSTIYPGLYYTGRRACDPLGTLPVTESLVIAGTGSQTGMNRVGDYAHTTLDPDGVTFWSTSEYMGGTTGSSAARTRIFSYQIPSCSVTAAVAISVTSGSNPTCTGSTVTFTATPTNGGTAPVYQWKVNGANVGTNANTYTSASFVNGDVVTCVMTSNLSGVLGSPATSNAVTMNITGPVTPTVSIAQTAGSNPTCANTAVTFTASVTNGGTPSYAWTVNGAAAGTNASTFSSSSLANGSVIACAITSSLACASPKTASSNSITLSVTPSVTPSVSIALTTGTNPAASGTSLTFTATATNGGTTPSYQWKVNGTNVGTNAATYTSSTLTNGAVVTCVLTSNATCAVPSTATSNSITMSITGGTVSYCTATTTKTNFEYISKVVCGSINNTTASSGYANYSSLSTNVTIGTPVSLTVTIGSAYSTDRVCVFVDWNNNGVFTDTGENPYNSANGVGPFTASFTPPSYAAVGSVRMRIRLTDTSSGSNITACGTSTYGEVEDYTLNVAAAAALASAPPATNEEQVSQKSLTEEVSREAEMLNIYPNPNNGAFTIKSAHEGVYYIINESGQMVKSFRLNSENNFSYSVEDLPNGFYVVSGQNKFGISKQKIIVAH